MSKQVHEKMNIFKKMFFVLLVLDFIGLILAGIALIPTFKLMIGYGQLMMVITSAITAVILAVMLFDVLAKIFLIRSTLPTFSWSSGVKGYMAVAKLLLFFNFCAVIFNVLSIGGEGSTLLNQGNICLRLLASVAEMITIFFYLRTIKKVVIETKIG